MADIVHAPIIYDALLTTIGATRMLEAPEHNGYTWYGAGPGRPGLVITRPWDGGAADEGAPGLRTAEGERAFYAGYFRDPDGNKLCGYATGPG